VGVGAIVGYAVVQVFRSRWLDSQSFHPCRRRWQSDIPSAIPPLRLPLPLLMVGGVPTDTGCKEMDIITSPLVPSWLLSPSSSSLTYSSSAFKLFLVLIRTAGIASPHLDLRYPAIRRTFIRR
jgi:hypothetical protein